MKLYYLDSEDNDPRYCFVGGGLSVGTLIEAGEPALPRMAQLQEDALELAMNEDAGGLELPDYVSNTSNLLPLRRACAAAIAELLDIGEHELLPARLINEKGRVHADDYVIVNMLGLIDCLDRSRSDMSGDMVRIMGRWCLQASKVPVGRDLFRAAGVLEYIFSERLVAFVEAQGFTNMRFHPVTTS